jgi:hypothetical protein
MVMNATRLSAVTLLALGGSALAAVPAQSAESSMVSVLHAVPGATVDVYANGKPLLTDFTPGTLTDPVSLAAGSYDLKVVKAGDGADGAAVIEANDVTVPGGANITVVAHLTADGKPVLTPYVNDTSMLEAGKGRLTVRHDAAAPAVDVRANGTVAFGGLVNPKEVKADLPAGTIQADVVLAGTSDVAIGPAPVTLKAGTNTIVYAGGSAADKNLELAVQTVSTQGGMPGGVPAGTGGQASDDALRPYLVAGLALFAAGTTLMLTRRRATASA